MVQELRLILKQYSEAVRRSEQKPDLVIDISKFRVNVPGKIGLAGVFSVVVAVTAVVYSWCCRCRRG